MCGIFGIVYRNGVQVPDADRLERTLERIGHRGPDSAGSHSEAGIGLAHRRLSLVDLSERGGQPFWDPSGRYALVYNGEIYNFKALRTELEQVGVRFSTTSDTEVLLQCLIRWGAKETLPRLEGMFAFAWFDREQRTLLLARDRFGIKPLAIYQDEDVFVFASEIKAMAPWVELEANPFPIASYLLGFGGPTKGACFFKGVRIVPPGTMVSLSIGEEPQYESFLEITDMVDPDVAGELGGLSDEQVVDRMDEALQHSVSQMLFADAPVGAFCSGGVDSSILMAMAARQHHDLAIFHANVAGPLSEYPAALALSKHLKLDLKDVEVRDQDFIDRIPEVTDHYEHPFEYHPNSVPFLMVSQLVRESGVKAVLSGEGADECFLGYDFLAQEPAEQWYARQVARVRGVVQRIPKLGRRLWPDPETQGEFLKGMFSQFEREMEEERNVERFRMKLGSDPGPNVRTAHLLGYHLRTLLHRNDVLGMAASIEARFPFLDENLVKLAINLPHRHKIRVSPFSGSRGHPFLRDKWIVRKVADRYLPRELSRRRKVGFHMATLDRVAVPSSYFADSFVSEYFALGRAQLEHLCERSDQTFRMQLLLLDVWGEICLGRRSKDEMKSKVQRELSFAD